MTFEKEWCLVSQNGIFTLLLTVFRETCATEFVCVDPQEVARSSGHWYLQPFLDPGGEWGILGNPGNPRKNLIVTCVCVFWMTGILTICRVWIIDVPFLFFRAVWLLMDVDMMFFFWGGFELKPQKPQGSTKLCSESCYVDTTDSSGMIHRCSWMAIIRSSIVFSVSLSAKTYLDSLVLASWSGLICGKNL